MLQILVGVAEARVVIAGGPRFSYGCPRRSRRWGSCGLQQEDHPPVPSCMRRGSTRGREVHQGTGDCQGLGRTMHAGRNLVPRGFVPRSCFFHHGDTRVALLTSGQSRSRAPPYLARQMSRVGTRTPGVTNFQLSDLFGSGVGEMTAFPLMIEG